MVHTTGPYHTYHTMHEQIEGGIAHTVSDLMLGQGAEGFSDLQREAQGAQQGDGERGQRGKRERESFSASCFYVDTASV